MAAAMQSSVYGGHLSQITGNSERTKVKANSDIKLGSLTSEFVGLSHVSTYHTKSSVKKQDAFVVSAKIRKTKRAPMDPDYPWPAKYKAEEYGFLAWLSKFNKQAPKKPEKPMTLPFERDLVDLEKKIEEVKTTFHYLCFSWETLSRTKLKYWTMLENHFR